MIQPTPTASPRKRTAPKLTPKSAHPAKAPAADSLPTHTPREAALIGRFVRRSADRIAAQIADETQDLRALLIAVDGDEQCGLHELKMAMMNLDLALGGLSAAIGKTKVRGEAGYSGD